MLKKIIIISIIALFTLLFVAQYNAWVQRTVTQFLCTELERALDCDITFCPHSINFFYPEIVLHDLVVCPRKKKGWQWSCARYVSGFSWWHVIRHGFLAVYVRVDECCVQSEMNNGNVAIMSHFKALLEAPLLPIPVEIKTVELHKATGTFTDMQQKIRTNVAFNIESKKHNAAIKTAVYITDAQCSIQDRRLISGMSAYIESVKHVGYEQKMTVRVNSNLELPQLDNGTCFLTGIWENGNGRFSLRHMQQMLSVDPIIISHHDDGTPSIQAKARIPLSYIWRIITNDIHTKKISGTGLLHMRGSFGLHTQIDSQLIFQDMHYDNYGLGSAYKISCHQRDNHINGSVQIRAQSTDISGNWQWHYDTNVGNLFLHNNGDITIPHARYWHIPPHGFSLAVSCNEKNEITSSYTCNAIHATRNVTSKTNGSLEITNNAFHINGIFNDCYYRGNGTIKPTVCVDTFACKNQYKETLFCISGKIYSDIANAFFSASKKKKKNNGNAWNYLLSIYSFIGKYAHAL